MKNHIFYIKSVPWESLAITDNEIWLSSSKVRSLDKFEEGVNKTGMMKTTYAYSLSTISEVAYNESTESVKIRYRNEKGKDKKLNMDFGDEDLSNEFGQWLGEYLNLTKSEKKENQLKKLLEYLFLLVLTIGGTYFLATMEDTSGLTDSSSRRTRNRGAFLKLIVDTIGQTGVIIVGALISAYLIYQLYTRYTNPASDILYIR